MKVAIGADHAGFNYKQKIVKYLQDLDFEVFDFGSDSESASDYPDFANLVGKAVSLKKVDLGVLICGTGIGMSISANKVKGVRAALITNAFSAESSRTHNHANVICFGSRVNSLEQVLDFIEIFLKSKESEEERHINRVEKIGRYEKDNE